MIHISNLGDYNNLKMMNIDLCPGRLLSSIEGVLSPVECNHMITLSERLGYKKASLYTDRSGMEHYFNDVRNSLRTMLDDRRFAKILEKRIWHLIPKVYGGLRYHSINERLRFLKYDGCGHFSRHTDGQYSDGERISMITVLIYLNEGYMGGYTTFYPDNGSVHGFSLTPKMGMVSLMDQGISHEVPELTSGIKYVVRTELMYSK